MNECRFKIKLVPDESVCTNLSAERNATYYSIVNTSNGVQTKSKSIILEGLTEMCKDLSHGLNRVLVKLPITMSGDIKRLGGELLFVLISRQGMFLIDFNVINNHLTKKEYNTITLEGVSNREVDAHFYKGFPQFYGNRIDDYGNSFVHKSFCKEDIAFISIDEFDSSPMRISELVSLIEHNATIFKYYDVSRVVLDLPYDFDRNNLANISCSFLGRFKSVSKSFVIIYVGQNKRLLGADKKELIGVGY